MTRHISQEQLSEWLDRQLPADESSRVKEHLSACETCRALEREWSAVTTLFQEAETLTPPPALWASIASELQFFQSGKVHRPKFTTWLASFRGQIGWPAWLQVRALVPAAALTLVLIAGVSLTWQQYQSEGRHRAAAMAEIDRARATLVAENLPTYNPFHATTGLDPERNPFSLSQIGIDPNPFRPLLSGSPEEGPK
jgi:anti-sigma factor RsiW